MVTSPRFKFTATVVVSVLAAVLTLAAADDDTSAEGRDSPSRLASPSHPAPR